MTTLKASAGILTIVLLLTPAMAFGQQEREGNYCISEGSVWNCREAYRRWAREAKCASETKACEEGEDQVGDCLARFQSHLQEHAASPTLEGCRSVLSEVGVCEHFFHAQRAFTATRSSGPAWSCIDADLLALHKANLPAVKAMLASMPELLERYMSIAANLFDLKVKEIPPLTTLTIVDGGRDEVVDLPQGTFTRDSLSGKAILRFRNPCYVTYSSDGALEYDLQAYAPPPAESERRSMTIDLSQGWHPRFSLEVLVGEPEIGIEKIRFPSSEEMSAQPFLQPGGAPVCYGGLENDARLQTFDVRISGQGRRSAHVTYTISMRPAPDQKVHLPPRGIKVFIQREDLRKQGEMLTALLRRDLSTLGVNIDEPALEGSPEEARKYLSAAGHYLGIYGQQGSSPLQTVWRLLTQNLPVDADTLQSMTQYDHTHLLNSQPLLDRLKVRPPRLVENHLPFVVVDMEGAQHPVVFSLLEGAPSEIRVGMGILKAQAGDQATDIRSAIDLSALIAESTKPIQIALWEPGSAASKWVEVTPVSDAILLAPRAGVPLPDLPLLLFWLAQEGSDPSRTSLQRYAANLNLMVLLLGTADKDATYGVENLLDWLMMPDLGDCRSKVPGCGTVNYYSRVTAGLPPSATEEELRSSRLDGGDGVTLGSRIRIRAARGK